MIALFFSRSKQRNENPGYVFLDFTLFNNITLEKTRKNIFSEAKAFERDFMKSKITSVKLALSKEIL